MLIKRIKRCFKQRQFQFRYSYVLAKKSFKKLGENDKVCIKVLLTRDKHKVVLCVVPTSSLRLETRRTVASGSGGAVSARSAGEAGVSVSAPNAGSPTPPTPTP